METLVIMLPAGMGVNDTPYKGSSMQWIIFRDTLSEVAHVRLYRRHQRFSHSARAWAYTIQDLASAVKVDVRAKCACIGDVCDTGN